MGKEFKSINQLNSYLNAVSAKAVNWISNRIKIKLQENIDKYIYDDYQPEFYERTGEFRNAWTIQASKDIANKIVGWVMYDYTKLSPPRSPIVEGVQFVGQYIHGYNDGEGTITDRRKQLAGILNRAVLFDDEWDLKDVTRKGAYFDETVEWVCAKWKSLVSDAFSAYGIKLSGNFGTTLDDGGVEDIF